MPLTQPPFVRAALIEPGTFSAGTATLAAIDMPGPVLIDYYVAVDSDGTPTFEFTLPGTLPMAPSGPWPGPVGPGVTEWVGGWRWLYVSPGRVELELEVVGGDLDVLGGWISVQQANVR